MTQGYRLDDQIGYMLRLAHQRHVNIFSTHIGEDLTPTQFTVLARLLEIGASTQNSLGRQAGMDVATITGVVSRLQNRGLVSKRPAPDDKRMHLVELTPEGRRTVKRAVAAAIEISRLTLATLDKAEQQTLLRLLRKLT